MPDIYAYVGGNPVLYTDPLGLGPGLAFVVGGGTCTAINALYTAYESYRATQIDGRDELQSKLDSVNRKIEECPDSDTTQRGDLEDQRKQLMQRILKGGRTYGSNQLRGSAFDGAAMREAGCVLVGGLAALAGLLAPTP